MGIESILMLLGGLALFLYGMQTMSTGLEAAAGDKMQRILEKLTSNRIKGVLVGAVITAVIQSSSATTVMVVGFVNSGLMTLNQAVWVIMGANIGTTITGQLIALDISLIAPMIAFVGVVMIMFIKNETARHIGEVIAGLGVLFIGMGMMSDSMVPLRESEEFVGLMTKFSNPALGILVGAGFTAIIQSSSASVGILQALAGSGVIGLNSAVYVLFGQNIGTCITAVLASIGMKTNAKRTTVIHLMFNIIGTVLFTVICMVSPFVSWMEALTPGNSVAQIANVHTTFNVVTTLLLLPFGNLMADVARRILPHEDTTAKAAQKMEYLVPIDLKKIHLVGQMSLALSLLGKEVERMRKMVEENVSESFELVLRQDTSALEDVEAREEYIDYMNAEISRYIGKLAVVEMSGKNSQEVNSYFTIVGNLERIGDHAMNIAGYAKNLKKRKLKLTEKDLEEVRHMKELSLAALNELSLDNSSETSIVLRNTAINEQKIDDMKDRYRLNQIKRINEGNGNMETSILYAEMLTDFERIGDHALNIAEQYEKIATA